MNQLFDCLKSFYGCFKSFDDCYGNAYFALKCIFHVQIIGILQIDISLWADLQYFVLINLGFVHRLLHNQ
jgi:hypothetical protein